MPSLGINAVIIIVISDDKMYSKVTSDVTCTRSCQFQRGIKTLAVLHSCILRHPSPSLSDNTTTSTHIKCTHSDSLSISQDTLNQLVKMTVLQLTWLVVTEVRNEKASGWLRSTVTKVNITLQSSVTKSDILFVVVECNRRHIFLIA